MTNIKLWLQQVKERLKKTTNGPWRFVDGENENRVESWDHRMICKGGKDISPLDISPENGYLIANAREDLEKLIEVYERDCKTQDYLLCWHEVYSARTW